MSVDCACKNCACKNKNIEIVKLLLKNGADINIKNNGQHSDFFWMFNSEFRPNNILNNSSSVSDKLALKKIGINKYKSELAFL